MNAPRLEQHDAHAPFRFERTIKEKNEKVDVGWLLILVSIGIAALGAVGIALILTVLGAGLMLKNWLSGDDEHVLVLEMLEDIQISGSNIAPHDYRYDDILKVELSQAQSKETLTLCLHSKDGKQWRVFSKAYALHELIDFFQAQGLEVSEQGKYSAMLMQAVSTERRG